jgi:hypothetical protein
VIEYGMSEKNDISICRVAAGALSCRQLRGDVEPCSNEFRIAHRSDQQTVRDDMEMP